jgi:hypothetical protein
MRSSFVKLPFIDMFMDLLKDPLELMVDLGDVGLLYLRNEFDDE